MANVTLTLTGAAPGPGFSATTLNLTNLLKETVSSFGSTGVTWTKTTATSNDTSSVTGSGLVPVVVGGKLTDVTAGTISALHSSASFHSGTTNITSTASYTGLIANAAHFFDLAFAHQWQSLFNYAFRGNDHVTGSGGNDKISGAAGADVLNGGLGDDTLIGGTGMDRLTGGAGADHFVFSNGADKTGVDQITDFTHGVDHIDLNHNGFAGLGAAGALDPSHFTTGAASAAEAMIAYNSVTGLLSFDPDGTGLTPALAFAHVVPGTIVTSSDFLIT